MQVMVKLRSWMRTHLEEPPLLAELWRYELIRGEAREGTGEKAIETLLLQESKTAING